MLLLKGAEENSDAGEAGFEIAAGKG